MAKAYFMDVFRFEAENRKEIDANIPGFLKFLKLAIDSRVFTKDKVIGWKVKGAKPRADDWAVTGLTIETIYRG